MLFRLLPGCDEIFMGIADANRTKREYLETLGFFLNLLPIRFGRPPRGSTPFGAAVKTVRDRVYGALEHSAVPFDVLLNELSVTRSASAAPVFQVFVDYRQGTQERAAFADCAAAGEEWYHPRTGYDISLDLLENAGGDTLVTLQLQQSLYSQHHTELLLRAYIHLLESYTQVPARDVMTYPTSVWAPADIAESLATGKG